MSARGRAADDYQADPQGFYQTPPWATRAILPHLGLRDGAVVLEPGCGVGAIGKVLREEWGSRITIIGVEIDSARARRARRASVSVNGSKLIVFDDVLRNDLFKQKFDGLFDLCLTNPSFSIWQKVANTCFTLSARTTLLIPWNAAASQGRASWWREHPAKLHLLSKRPSFAISVRCEHANAKRARAAGVTPCSFQEMIPLDEEPRKECPRCHAGTTTTRSDSNEYCWAKWAPTIERNLWDPLPPPEEQDG